MPYLAVLGVGSWSPTRGARFKPGVYEVSDEIAAAARRVGSKRLLVSNDTPFIIAEDGEAYYAPPVKPRTLRPETVGDPDAGANLIDPEKEPDPSGALTTEHLSQGLTEERGVKLAPHPEVPLAEETEADVPDARPLATSARYVCEFCGEAKASNPSLARHIEFHHAVTK